MKNQKFKDKIEKLTSQVEMLHRERRICSKSEGRSDSQKKAREAIKRRQTQKRKEDGGRSKKKESRRREKRRQEQEKERRKNKKEGGLLYESFWRKPG